MENVLKLNEISGVVNEIFDMHGYNLSKDCKEPVAVLLRSYDMHGYDMPESVLCVGRAGAGVNNIPVSEYAENGVGVFNTPRSEERRVGKECL